MAIVTNAQLLVLKYWFAAKKEESKGNCRRRQSRSKRFTRKRGYDLKSCDFSKRCRKCGRRKSRYFKRLRKCGKKVFHFCRKGKVEKRTKSVYRQICKCCVSYRKKGSRKRIKVLKYMTGKIGNKRSISITSSQISKENEDDVKGGAEQKENTILSQEKKKGPLIGLQNLGLTCFLNSVLQAMASCVTFVQWLDSCRNQGEVAAALYYLLKVLSTEQAKLPEGVGDPLAPVVLRDALYRHGWIISPSEQDAHELYHLLMVTLEEESHKSAVAEGGIMDALEPKQTNANRDLRANIDSSAEQNIANGNVKDFVENKTELKKANGDLRANIGNEMDVDEQMDEATSSESAETNLNMECDYLSKGPSGDSIKSIDVAPSPMLRHGDTIYRKMLPKYDCNRNYQVSPFCGMLTSQLQCFKCNFKSVVRFDKFDSLSLHLPDTPRPQHTLSSLLERFTHTEAVTGVECEGCNLGRGSDMPPVTSTSFKTLSIGKLPKCLCIHIHRMSLGSNNTIYKRNDHVDFPEFLVMDPYTHNSLIKEKKSKEEPSRSDLNKNELEELQPNKVETKVEEEIPSTSHQVLPCRTGPQNVYRLQAVVVHRGSAQGGHFVTFRRGPLRSNTRLRWYYTSDDVIEESTLTEVMNAVAYMLFYEKYTNTIT